MKSALSLYPIVEGHGEVAAVPLLLRRIVAEIAPCCDLKVLRPHKIPKSKVVLEDELNKAVNLAAAKLQGSGALFLLLDADDDCPAELGPRLANQLLSARPDICSAVVVAKTEFESWFIAAADSLKGKRMLFADLKRPEDPESIRGAKEWLSRHSSRRYSETTDQPALTQLMDLRAARSASSFDKLWREMERLLRD